MKKTKNKHTSSSTYPQKKEKEKELKVINGFRIWESGYILKKNEIINHHPDFGLVVRFVN